MWARAIKEGEKKDRCFRCRDTSGKVWECDLHEGWKDGWSDLVGRVADLKSAYKQLPVHPASKSFSIVPLMGEDGAMRFYQALSLMFGETAAVYSFLRFSRALSFLGLKLFNLCLVEYFDDFT